jgi:hypothetical protein
VILLSSALRCSPLEIEKTSVYLFRRYFVAAQRKQLLVSK